MTTQKGIITLTILIFISGLLTVILLLDDSHLSFFSCATKSTKTLCGKNITTAKNDRDEKTNCLP